MNVNINFLIYFQCLSDIVDLCNSSEDETPPASPTQNTTCILERSGIKFKKWQLLQTKAIVNSDIIGSEIDLCNDENHHRFGNEFNNNEITLQKKTVSKEFYNEQVEILKKLKQSLLTLENTKSLFSLPDGGKKLSESIRLKRAEYNTQSQLVNSIYIRIEKRSSPQIIPPQSGHAMTYAADKTTTIRRSNSATAKNPDEFIQYLKHVNEKCPNPTDLAEQPKDVVTVLLPHQLHAIKWMHFCENKPPYGGIIADDMGTGKTLTCLSYISTTKMVVSKGNGDIIRGGTLVVCPLNVCAIWEDCLRDHFKANTLSNTVYHKEIGEILNTRQLARRDVVITTYKYVSLQAQNAGSLFEITWDRIILDEGHIIKNPTAIVSQACKSLKSEYKWICTGTPLQNTEEDIQSLFQFLRFEPLSDCKTFKQWYKSLRPEDLNNVLSLFLLRRTKIELISKGAFRTFECEKLCEKVINVVEIDLTKEERQIYEHIQNQSLKHKSDNNLLLYYMRLRQTCVHAHLLQQVSAICKNLYIYYCFLTRINYS